MWVRLLETDGRQHYFTAHGESAQFQGIAGQSGYSMEGLLPAVVTVPAGQEEYEFNITGIDDMLAQTMNRSIEISVAEGLGYTVSPDKSAVTLMIAEDDIVALVYCRLEQ